MKKVFLLFLVTTIAICGGCKYKLKYIKVKKLEKKSGFEETSFGTRNSFIRDKPITNREYILFLCWNIQIYSQSFPEYVAKLIPCDSVNFSNLTEKDFFKLLRNNADCLNEYVLNVNYIDYPVTGLNLFQLGELYKWMSDRYAENALVKIGYFVFHSDWQKDEDSFSLETFLGSQYMGNVRSFDEFNFNDNILIPNFRPPFQTEKSYGKKRRSNNRNVRIWSECPMIKNDFLWDLNKLYIVKEGNKLKLQIEQSSYDLNSMKGTVNYENRGHVFYLKGEKEFYSKAKYIESIAGIRKDEFGKMPYIYTGKNLYGRPIIIEKYKFQDEAVSNPNNAFYWLVYNNEIESQYWPFD